MMHWIQYVLLAIESFGTIFFFDSFMDKRKPAIKLIYYPIIYAEILAIIYLTQLIPVYGEVVKSLLIVVALIITCRFLYNTGLVAGIFFSALNYIIMFFVDCVYVGIFGMEETAFTHFLWVMVKLIWITLLVLMRKMLPHIKRYLKEDRVSWTRFAWLPIFSGVIGIYLYIFFLSDSEPIWFYSVISLGIICLNIVSLLFMQEALLREEKLKQSEIQLQNKQNQLQIFHDMQSLYERQGKKLHDYKKQLVTVQELIESGNPDAAANLAKELTQSIAVEMSEVNTGHPVVNAVLNQEYRIAKGKGISMIFSISEAEGIKLNDEDVVVVFGNLLDNAIHECEKVVGLGKDAVIHVKIAAMDQEMIFTVQNPVIDQVQIDENNEVKGEFPEGHGIGLINVRETAERYGGSLVISCDEKEFTAVVVI